MSRPPTAHPPILVAAILSVLGVLPACAEGARRVVPGADAGAGADALVLPDTSPPMLDAGPRDTGARDTSPPMLDGGPRDTGPADTGPRDTGVRDTGPVDTGPPDTGLPDTGPPDTGIPDAGPPDTGMPDAGGPTAECMAALAAANDDFEAGAPGWTHGPMDDAELSGLSWPFDQWELGSATHGPGACAGGAGCWGMDLDENYTQCTRAELVSPRLDLSACAGSNVVLVFDHWYAFWSNGTYSDGGVVEVGNEGDFWGGADVATTGTIVISQSMGIGYSCWSSDDFYVDRRAGFVGTSGGWVTEEASISALLASPLLVRFAYGAGVAGRTVNPDTSRTFTEAGWYVDNVRFEAR